MSGYCQWLDLLHVSSRRTSYISHSISSSCKYAYYSPLAEERSIVMSTYVCLSVSARRSYLGNYTSNLQMFMLPQHDVTYMAVARSLVALVVIRYVLPILWMMSCLRIAVARNRQRKKAHTQSGSTGGSNDLIRQRIPRLTHRGTALTPGTESDETALYFRWQRVAL